MENIFLFQSNRLASLSELMEVQLDLSQNILNIYKKSFLSDPEVIKNCEELSDTIREKFDMIESAGLKFSRKKTLN